MEGFAEAVTYYYVLVNHDRNHSQTESVAHLILTGKTIALVDYTIGRGYRLYLPVSILNW